MIKNRTAQLIFYTIYVVLAAIGLLGSLGYFDKSFNTNFYVYYTNLSNYICFGFMVVELVKISKKKQDDYSSVAPKFKFMCLVMIMVTLLVYNILLTGGKTVGEYFGSLNNVLMHLVLPIMFILDWILFYEHGKLKWVDPLLCTVMPLIYVVCIVIRAKIMSGVEGALLYPYFFLNIDNLGWGGFFGWVIGLVLVFVALGYLFMLFDRFKDIKKKSIKK